MHAEDGDSAEAGRVSGVARDDAREAGSATSSETESETAEPEIADSGSTEADSPEASETTETAEAAESTETTEPAENTETGRRGLPLTNGIGCAALLLPLVAVVGAILCFAAGILSTASGCSTNGSALCSSSGPLIAFALPVFVSPLVAAGTAIGAVTVRRHRSTWLAVGYGIVFISIIIGLASASTGS